MRISGYDDRGLPIEEIQPVELAEITISASPDELRKISAFLLAAADSMEQMGTGYSHVHLSDKQEGFDGSPHVTVFNSAPAASPNYSFKGNADVSGLDT